MQSLSTFHPLFITVIEVFQLVSPHFSEPHLSHLVKPSSIVFLHVYFYFASHHCLSKEAGPGTTQTDWTTGNWLTDDMTWHDRPKRIGPTAYSPVRHTALGLVLMEGLGLFTFCMFLCIRTTCQTIRQENTWWSRAMVSLWFMTDSIGVMRQCTGHETSDPGLALSIFIHPVSYRCASDLFWLRTNRADQSQMQVSIAVWLSAQMLIGLSRR